MTETVNVDRALLERMTRALAQAYGDNNERPFDGEMSVHTDCFQCGHSGETFFDPADLDLSIEVESIAAKARADLASLACTDGGTEYRWSMASRRFVLVKPAAVASAAA